MSNPLYQAMMSKPGLPPIFQQIEQLKKTIKGNPNDKIQELLNSGKVSQAQYNAAVQQAQNIARMMGMK